MDEIVFDENGYVVEPKQQNQEYEASFFLLITQDVLFNKDLTDFQKLLYAAITGLCKKKVIVGLVMLILQNCLVKDILK